MAMCIDQAGKQRLLAKIGNFTGVARFDFIEQSNVDDSISFDRDGAVLDGRSIHRHNEAGADNHFPAVAAVYDRRKYSWEIMRR
jgi:hypothetical protein